MAKCIYPKCYSCTLEYCIKDIQTPKKNVRKKTEQHIRRITIKRTRKKNRNSIILQELKIIKGEDYARLDRK